jgi:transmembrane sensor
LEGKTGSDHIELNPGDVVVAKAGKLSLTRVPTEDLTDRLSWRSGKLMFHHAPLSQVAAEFNRYNGTKVVIAGEGARDMTINGTFATNDVQAFGRIAQTILGLKVDHQGTKIVISR